jgi:pre-mRNA 3'-end-processing factor FIP1
MSQHHKLPSIYYFDFKRQAQDKKWQNKDLDITDYFNYGYNEEIWKCYTNKVRKLCHL